MDMDVRHTTWTIDTWTYMDMHMLMQASLYTKLTVPAHYTEVLVQLWISHARNEDRFIAVVFGPTTRSDTCRADASPVAAAVCAVRPQAQHARSG